MAVTGIYMASQTIRLMWESPFQALLECRDQVVGDSILLQTVRWMKDFGELLSPQTSHVSFTVIKPEPNMLFFFYRLCFLEMLNFFYRLCSKLCPIMPVNFARESI